LTLIVDANVVIDLLTGNPDWYAWSAAAVQSDPEIVINDVIFSEISTTYETLPAFRAALAQLKLSRAPIPDEALFCAGKAYLAYRRAGGTRTNVLPDFFIGAHAATMGWPLITRDTRNYQTYFPDVTLITP
jgi:predicted nucleic acid-binding protein